MKIKLTILIIFSFSFSFGFGFGFGFGQNKLNLKFKKIIHQTVKRANSKYSLFGIDNALYSKFSSEIKPSDKISFYTTSNVPLCDLNVLRFYNLKVAKIKKFQNCKEPTSESVTKIS